MIGLASYLLEKEAGFKQVKRMLEAAQKSPAAANRLRKSVNLTDVPLDINDALHTVDQLKGNNAERTSARKFLGSIGGFRTDGTRMNFKNTRYHEGLENMRQTVAGRDERLASLMPGSDPDRFPRKAPRINESALAQQHGVLGKDPIDAAADISGNMRLSGPSSLRMGLTSGSPLHGYGYREYPTVQALKDFSKSRQYHQFKKQ